MGHSINARARMEDFLIGKAGALVGIYPFACLLSVFNILSIYSGSVTALALSPGVISRISHLGPAVTPTKVFRTVFVQVVRNRWYDTDRLGFRIRIVDILRQTS